MIDTLPPLPEPFTEDEYGKRAFTADQMREYAAEALAAAVAEPVAIHQWRKRLCADWYDGHPDHEDGGGPYETRTLYAAPPQREPMTHEQAMPHCDLFAGAPGVSRRAWLIGFRAAERAHGIAPTAAHRRSRHE